MTVIGNDEIRPVLYCRTAPLPLGLMIDPQVWIYFTAAAIISALWHRPCLRPADGKDMKPQQFLILFLPPSVTAREN